MCIILRFNFILSRQMLKCTLYTEKAALEQFSYTGKEGRVQRSRIGGYRIRGLQAASLVAPIDSES